MAFINIFVSKPYNLHVKDNQLVVDNTTFPLQEVNCLMIDNYSTTLSCYALNALVQANATIIVCDKFHMPSVLCLPYQGYYKRLAVLECQMDMPKPRKKQLWQTIVKNKLLGQAKCLQLLGIADASNKLVALSKQVASNDADNKEAEGARLYFAQLFGETFSRKQENATNGALNYCYAIVRSLIARHLCARGFECALGIFHKNKLNAFNLVDDVLELFRPIVDYLVCNCDIDQDELSSATKKQLFCILNVEVGLDNKKISLSNAVERVCESLLAYYKQEVDEICIPQLIGCRQCEYE